MSGGGPSPQPFLGLSAQGGEFFPGLRIAAFTAFLGGGIPRPPRFPKALMAGHVLVPDRAHIVVEGQPRRHLLHHVQRMGHMGDNVPALGQTGAPVHDFRAPSSSSPLTDSGFGRAAGGVKGTSWPMRASR